MDPATTAIFIKLVVVPIVAELLERRGIKGVTRQNLEAFTKDPEGILASMQQNTTMQRRIVKDIADSVDFFGSGLVDAFGLLFVALAPGGGVKVEDDDS